MPTTNREKLYLPNQRINLSFLLLLESVSLVRKDVKILWSSLASNIYLQDTINDILFIMSNRAVNNSILLTGLDLAGRL